MASDIQQALTTSSLIKGATGVVRAIDWYNPDAATSYVFLYDTSAAPTIGSTTNLLYQKGLPAGAGCNVSFDIPLTFNSGIYIAVSADPTDSSAPSTGLVLTTIFD